MTPGKVDRLVAKLKELIAKANGQKEVTVAQLKRSARCKASERTILNALHERRVYFRRMREKPVLTDQDRKDRLAFAKEHAGKPASWWRQKVHLHIDVKRFPVFLHGDARRFAAQQGVRGAYRTPGDGLGAAYVRPGRALKYNAGAKAAEVLAGVGDGGVKVWEYVEGNWSADQAVHMYTAPILAALRAAHPSKRTFQVLEDNDPTGFKSRKGVDAKQKSQIEPLDLPKRSPDLNVCDYAVWSEVNRRMRQQEAKWPKDKKEKRDAYLRRLRRTAVGLPAEFVNKAIENMKRRCEQVLQAKGGLIQEGS